MVTLALNLLSQILLFFLIAVVLLIISPTLALLAFSIMPLIVLIALGFRHIARRTTQRSQRSLARVNANVQEVVSGIAVAKNFRQEQTMYDEFKKVNEQSYQVNMRSGFVCNGVFPLLVLVANIGTVIVVYFGGLNVLNHTISAGAWFLFIQAIRLLWFPLTSIASFWSQFQLGLAASSESCPDRCRATNTSDRPATSRSPGRKNRIQRRIFQLQRQANRAGWLRSHHSSG